MRVSAFAGGAVLTVALAAGFVLGRTARPALPAAPPPASPAAGPAASAAPPLPASSAPAPALESPRIERLWNETRGDPAPALGAFWDEMKGKTPLVEPIPGDTASARVTFLWRGPADTPYVAVNQGPPGYEIEKPLRVLAGTDVWYLTARLPLDSRIQYGFYAGAAPPPAGMTIGGMMERNRAMKPDPLNATEFYGSSLAVLPGAAPQPFVAEDPRSPKGALHPLEIESARLGEARRVVVYTPAGYDPSRADTYGVAAVFDGEWYGSGEWRVIHLPTILDNLIARRRIAPLVVALVDNQGKRERDLSLSEPFADFVTLEVMPRLAREYPHSKDPRRAIVGGSSLGGLEAGLVALRHPEVFGNVLSQSGAFFVGPGGWKPETPYYQNPAWLMEKVITLTRQPVRWWMEVGAFEAETLLGSNRHLRDVLRARGYVVDYREYHGAHDYTVWRGTIADGLMALSPPR